MQQSGTLATGCLLWLYRAGSSSTVPFEFVKLVTCSAQEKPVGALSNRLSSRGWKIGGWWCVTAIQTSLLVFSSRRRPFLRRTIQPTSFTYASAATTTEVRAYSTVGLWNKMRGGGISIKEKMELWRRLSMRHANRVNPISIYPPLSLSFSTLSSLFVLFPVELWWKRFMYAPFGDFCCSIDYCHKSTHTFMYRQRLPRCCVMVSTQIFHLEYIYISCNISVIGRLFRGGLPSGGCRWAAKEKIKKSGRII